MGIKAPLIVEIAPKTYAINEYGLSTMFLVEGEEKSMLIDAGCGTCDLPVVVKGLTQKPLTVIITHGHLDHVGGMGFFQEIYIHPADVELAKSNTAQTLQGYADNFGKGGGYDIYDYDIAAICERPLLHFLPLSDGDVFDLGGREIRAIHIPGHTPGGFSFLDEKNRIMFSGDCCNFNLLALGCSVEETLEGLRKFKTFEDKFDRNYNGHLGYMNKPNCFSQPETVTDDLIHACEIILVGKADLRPYQFLGMTLYQTGYGTAKISYDPENIKRK